MQAKVTATVEVVTYWGYRTKRTFSTLPSPGWEERVAAWQKEAGESINDEIALVYGHMESDVLRKLERDGNV
jgi:hypothetical protein